MDPATDTIVCHGRLDGALLCALFLSVWAIVILNLIGRGNNDFPPNTPIPYADLFLQVERPTLEFNRMWR